MLFFELKFKQFSPQKSKDFDFNNDEVIIFLIFKKLDAFFKKEKHFLGGGGFYEICHISGPDGSI